MICNVFQLCFKRRWTTRVESFNIRSEGLTYNSVVFSLPVR
jgi:hypothetical protein